MSTPIRTRQNFSFARGLAWTGAVRWPFKFPGHCLVHFAFSLLHFFTSSLFFCPLSTVHYPLVIQITWDINSPLFGVEPHETNQHDHFLFACGSAFTRFPQQFRPDLSGVSRAGSSLDELFERRQENKAHECGRLVRGRRCDRVACDLLRACGSCQEESQQEPEPERHCEDSVLCVQLER